MTGNELGEIKDDIGCTSDRQLGNLIGYSRETVNQWRNGHKRIPYCVSALLRIYHDNPDLIPSQDGNEQ